jgi:gas vesicle protein
MIFFAFSLFDFCTFPRFMAYFLLYFFSIKKRFTSIHFSKRRSVMKYEYEKEQTNATTKLSYLLIGGGIGALLALLFAPKSGEELRGDIADVTRKGIEKGKETATLVGEKAGDYYEVTREKAGELYTTAQEKAGALTEKAQGAVSSASNPFSAALEAGKDAYADEKRRSETKAIVEGRPSYPVQKDRQSLDTSMDAIADINKENKV